MDKSLAVVVALVVTTLGACASESPQPSGPCAQRAGSYITTYRERSGTCGDPGERITNLDAQPTAPPPECSGSITYSKDNCDVTYTGDCPEDGIVRGGRLRITGKSRWDVAGSFGTATEQWFAADASGRTLCQSTYDVTVRRQ